MSVSDFVRGKGTPNSFCLKQDLVLKWLNDAKVRGRYYVNYKLVLDHFCLVLCIPRLLA